MDITEDYADNDSPLVLKSQFLQIPQKFDSYARKIALFSY